LRRALGPFDHAFTNGPEHASVLSRQALERDFEMVVAVGGDGTFNEVAGGFFEGRRSVAPDAVLGLVPQGTGCDFPRSIGLGTSTEEACARLARRTARRIDVGHARFVNPSGQPAERVFLNVVSFGCGGAVVHAISTSAAKRFGGKLAFMLVTATTLLRYRDQAVTVAVDDGTPETMAVTNYAVCNGQYFGGGMRVAPDAEVDDGSLDVTIWAGFGLKDFVLKRRLLYDGTHIHDPGTRTLRARSVVATSLEPVRLDIDGESAGYLPLSVEITPGALRLKA
jgi:YegS/Rv2252/BmrU family lipid kinase